jgi:ABC-type multidrug transport system ATPase subunit
VIACHDVRVLAPPDAPRPALDGITLDIEPGEIIAVAGTPGSGKTTLLRAIAGRVRLAGGSIRVDGLRPDARAARGLVAYVRAGLAGPPDLTPLEWLHYVAAQAWARRRVRVTRVQAVVALVGLGRDAGRRIASLDRDAAERLGLASAALAGSSAVLLDECLSGIRTDTRRYLADAFADLAIRGRAVLLAPLDVTAAEGVATRVVLLRDGRLLADLRMSDLQRERELDLTLNGAALRAVPRLQAHFPDARRTGAGISVPLVRGRSLESVLAVCRDERIAVAGSRVRYRAVEDLLCIPRAVPDPLRAAALG